MKLMTKLNKKIPRLCKIKHKFFLKFTGKTISQWKIENTLKWVIVKIIYQNLIDVAKVAFKRNV